jgi:ubiquinone/menaquinone biosynthesis C-methylase UbiE
METGETVNHKSPSAAEFPGLVRMTDTELKISVQKFWDKLPCGAKHADAPPGSRHFYEQVEAQRYNEEFHIPMVAEFNLHAGERVLEVGCGLGTDGRQFSRCGVHYTGCDLSFRSLSLARQGFQIYGLTGQFSNVDAECLPFSENRFDLVYSNGVLHHSPNTEQAVREVYRVLRPGGKAIVMLYARSATFVVGVHVIGRARLEMARRRMGREAFNRMAGLPADFNGWLPSQTVINHSTDGVGNPHSKLYSKKQVRRMFASFRHVEIERHYFPRQKLPVIGPRLPRPMANWLGRALGCALIIKATK